MLRIRLTRTGKKHQPTYRIVVAEHSAPIKGKYLEIVGYYLPTRNPKVLEIDAEKVKHWISKGAKASDTVHNMLVDKGILTEKRNIKYAILKPAKAKPAAPAQNQPGGEPKAVATETVVETPETIEVTDETLEAAQNLEATAKTVS